MSNNNRNTRSNSTKYGICTNMEPKQDGTMCSLCQKKEKQAIRSTKDFVCAECGAPLTEVTPPRPFPTKILISILSIILLVAAVVIGIVRQRGGDGEPVTVDTIDSTGAVQPIDSIPNTIHDTIILNDTTILVVRDTIVDTIIKEVPSKKTDSRGSNDKQAKSVKTYSFGKYVGNLKNGIPEGDGKMYYHRRVQIAKHDTDNPPHYAESGDWFDGTWGNGDIISGALYRKDGKIKERIFAPKRFNPYDLNKD